MVRKAYVLVECMSGSVAQAAEVIRGKSGVLAADVVTGPHDIIVTIQARDLDGVAKIVLMDISGAPGVNRTTTCNVVSLE